MHLLASQQLCCKLLLCKQEVWYLDALVHAGEAGRQCQALLGFLPECGVFLLEVGHACQQLLGFLLLLCQRLAQFPAQ
jgi:hypothetical protein